MSIVVKHSCDSMAACVGRDTTKETQNNEYFTKINMIINTIMII